MTIIKSIVKIRKIQEVIEMISDRAQVHWEEVIQESVGQLIHKIQHMTNTLEKHILPNNNTHITTPTQHNKQQQHNTKQQTTSQKQQQATHTNNNHKQTTTKSFYIPHVQWVVLT